MADFHTAFAITSGYEGGYANVRGDAGGETYRGVARNSHPSWPGWNIVDSLREKAGFPKNLDRDTELQQLVEDLYKSDYWDKIWGDKQPDQAIANEMFDTAVNMGVARAVTFVQSGLNLLNCNQNDYKDLLEDGRFGSITFTALKKYPAKDRKRYLLKAMVILRGMHYITIMRGNPTQEKFAHGWLNRVNFEKV